MCIRDRCSNCAHHNRINSDERIKIIADKDSFKEFNGSLSPTDPLKFKDRRSYSDRIKESQEGTGLKDGVITGICSINSMPLALAVMDFRFMGGSMGSVVGEKINLLGRYLKILRKVMVFGLNVQNVGKLLIEKI